MARRRKPALDLSLDPDTRKAVGIVFLFVFGALMLLGLFDLAGAFGRALDEALAYVFGWDRLVVPFLLFAWAYHVLAPDRLVLRFRNVIGFLFLFLSVNPLVHAFTFADQGALPIADSALMKAGGKLGMMLAEPFIAMLGFAGAVTVFVALFILAGLLGFNASLRQILFVIDIVWKSVAAFCRALIVPIMRWMQQKSQAKEQADKTVYSLQDNEDALEEEPSTDLEEDEEIEEDEEVEGDEEVDEEESEDEEDSEDVIQKPVAKRRRQPRIDVSVDLLERRDSRPQAGDIVHNREVIRRTLENFGIPVEMNEVAVGPTVTQFAFKPSEGIKLSRITALHNDLALALAAHPIRIEAPIPGKSMVGVEVPNQTIATVGLRELIDSKEFKERKSPLTFVLGKDVAGKPWVADLIRMPHMLVAGATGSGKSVCLNTIIMSYLYGLSPDDVKLIMVDPKRVELQNYNGIPHLLTPVITKVPETVNALKWALREMDRRYDLLAQRGVRDLATFNQRFATEKMPYIVIMIDELADLMVTSAAEVEGPIVRLAQMSRAVGIHLILATQRPSVDVITGLIKANIPGRIAFAVASATDSRTILDQQGAEKLLGRGDMLLSTAELTMPKRIQGAFVSEAEIARVVEFVKSQYEPADYDYSVTERPSANDTSFGGGGGDDMDNDPLAEMAKEEIVRAGKASASLLQRRLKVGYARAARILDVLEQQGFIGPSDGAKPREILKTEFTRSSENAALSAAVAATADIMDMNTDEDEESGF
jgi:S-DNA-T family DNA segregation ATPase FtsK/SpoIIIE